MSFPGPWFPRQAVKNVMAHIGHFGLRHRIVAG